MKKKIKEMPGFLRPREKMQERGPAALTDVELIAIILGSGNRDQDVMTLSARIAGIISAKRGNLVLDDLLSVDGVGLAKASQILSGFELARRYTSANSVVITEPGHVLPLLSDIAGKQQEHFVCISLNGANEVIEKRLVTVGLLNNCQVHPREVFADVITDRAASVIFAHNHPSGELIPSRSDLDFQQQLCEAGKILGINIIDHLIVSKKGYYSFQENGLIN
ncbi:MAG: DNA repair protein RadC [Spirochaetes bacterium]|nr:DNA repair protein RadC [Spirochaetota bacterium]